MKVISISFVIMLLSLCISCQINNSKKYLNQQAPGVQPKIFAPGIISTENEYEFGSVFSENADEFYYAVRLNDDWKAEIRYTKVKNGVWCKPERLELDTLYGYNDPFLSNDGNRLYFMSDRPRSGKVKPGDSNLWYIEKSGEKDGS